ncbi:hypothetical protein IW140_003414 [Coemansia sp. RSA 1813]|nr:hypothetical protein EV178_003232 [Coemansia sp. RSA 1646]KAJ1767889.1 hypothetical protein LPJ74_005136 [Coemansia sp. RSA 1843]KAJ2089278.1 hypothetical protein IW138_003598 [Coemansia sp. RSA 986]KAJ2215107.1 hypothetical protein EV179_002475 [Coemansia sp. RSA 487]KAJ2569049.1 hypothetical protein IW140_003414 [Coemansia sp. RSA 1813]
MRIERILARLETGLGATQLSSQVQKVTLTLSQRTRASGARHFWREHLRRLQYANPALPIQVNYPREPCLPKLEIKFADAAVDSFSISGMRSDDICKQFLDRANRQM